MTAANPFLDRLRDYLAALPTATQGGRVDVGAVTDLLHAMLASAVATGVPAAEVRRTVRGVTQYALQTQVGDAETARVWPSLETLLGRAGEDAVAHP